MHMHKKKAGYTFLHDAYVHVNRHWIENLHDTRTWHRIGNFYIAYVASSISIYQRWSIKKFSRDQLTLSFHHELLFHVEWNFSIRKISMTRVPFLRQSTDHSGEKSNTCARMVRRLYQCLCTRKGMYRKSRNSCSRTIEQSQFISSCYLYRRVQETSCGGV